MIVNAEFVKCWGSPEVKAIRKGDITSWEELMGKLSAASKDERLAIERAIRSIVSEIKSGRIKKSLGDLMAVIALLDL